MSEESKEFIPLEPQQSLNPELRERLVAYGREIVEQVDNNLEVQADVEDFLRRSEKLRPQVEGPNARPSGSRFDTFTGNYANGGSPRDMANEVVELARRNFLENQKQPPAQKS